MERIRIIVLKNMHETLNITNAVGKKKMQCLSRFQPSGPKLYTSDSRYWPLVLCCAVVRRKSASLRLVSMRSDTILPQ
jgi:hypothetical protein